MITANGTKATESLLSTAIERVESNQPLFDDLFPNLFPNYGEAHHYLLRENNNWLAAFWPGMLWLAYDQTGSPALREAATALLPTFAHRLDEEIHITHDLGFLFSLSARAQYQLTGDPAAAELALRAADLLLGRYRQPGRYIQAWGALDDPVESGRIIMDTMLNLPLLFWASNESGDPRYNAAALDHARITSRHMVRPDGSTFHTFFFDQESGAPRHGATHQGVADDSLWSRGQAWGILGFAIAADWLPHERFLVETARTLARRFMAELPSDDVPLWDCWLPADAPRYRDSSAAAIALCGLLRLVDTDPAHAQEYQAYARRLLDALTRHCWDDHAEAQGLLEHGALHVPKGIATDSYVIFGDYFMLEALLRLSGQAPDFWGVPTT